MHFFRFSPIYQERIWGGRALERFGRECLPKHGNIGESWEICDRTEANTRVKGGEYDGYSLRELIRLYGDKIMGPGWHPERPFPILVKWLDSRDRLSLQVHPPLAVARQHGGEPKTESWYVAEAEPHAGLYCGLKKGVTREHFEAALRRNAASECVHRVKVEKGDVLHTPSGRLHAIDAGCLILEIQQNSDTTYRVYDWGRPRQLQIDESLRCIDFNDCEPQPLRTGNADATLAECENYRLRLIVLGDGQTYVSAEGEPRIISVVEGRLRDAADTGTIVRGENILLPMCSGYRFSADGPAVILVTDRIA